MRFPCLGVTLYKELYINPSLLSAYAGPVHIQNAQHPKRDHAAVGAACKAKYYCSTVQTHI